MESQSGKISYSQEPAGSSFERATLLTGFLVVCTVLAGCKFLSPYSHYAFDQAHKLSRTLASFAECAAKYRRDHPSAGFPETTEELARTYPKCMEAIRAGLYQLEYKPHQLNGSGIRNSYSILAEPQDWLVEYYPRRLGFQDPDGFFFLDDKGQRTNEPLELPYEPFVLKMEAKEVRAWAETAVVLHCLHEFRAGGSRGRFPDSLAALGPKKMDCIPPAVVEGELAGYRYQYQNSPPGFRLVVRPRRWGQDGDLNLLILSKEITYFTRDDRPATDSDPGYFFFPPSGMRDFPEGFTLPRIPVPEVRYARPGKYVRGNQRYNTYEYEVTNWGEFQESLFRYDGEISREEGRICVLYDDPSLRVDRKFCDLRSPRDLRRISFVVVRRVDPQTKLTFVDNLTGQKFVTPPINQPPLAETFPDAANRPPPGPPKPIPPSSDFRVMNISFRLLRIECSGPPRKRGNVIFSGKIRVRGRGTVKYSLTRSEGFRPAVSTMNFEKSGEKIFGANWNRGKEGSGWVELEILSRRRLWLKPVRATFDYVCK